MLLILDRCRFCKTLEHIIVFFAASLLQRNPLPQNWKKFASYQNGKLLKTPTIQRKAKKLGVPSLEYPIL